MYVWPIRGSCPIPSSTGPTSTPRSSASPATSFANVRRRARKTFEAFFTRLASSARMTRSGVPGCASAPVTSASASGSGWSPNVPTTTRVGLRMSSSALPWRRNSGATKRRSGTTPGRFARRAAEPTGRVLRMTQAAPAAMAGAAWSRARATCDTSVEPVSSIGVPTQMTMRSRPSAGISALGTIRPAACWVAYASGSPGSWNGIRPSTSAARRSGSCSTSTTSRPCSARPTAVAIPTYPAPTTAVFNVSRVIRRGYLMDRVNVACVRRPTGAPTADET